MGGGNRGLEHPVAGGGTAWRRGLGAALVAITAACAPGTSTLRPPYGLDGSIRSEVQLQSVAADRCRQSADPVGSLPPKPFTTDGCTLSSNGSWTECCIAHDMSYWCGGQTALRQVADRLLSSCVTASGHPLVAKFMYLAVRLGGSPWLPFPWRWGYGYSWPRHSNASVGAPRDCATPAPNPEPAPTHCGDAER
jgi:hypothetical protein